MACVSFGGHQPLLFAMPIVIVISLYFLPDEVSETILLIALQNEDATCGDFQDAPSEVQAEFLQDCDCLDDAGADGNQVDLSPAILESCVREAVRACAEDDSLHRITRACAAPGEDMG
jgi:hypothetical protein